MACVLLGCESPSLPVGLVKQFQSAPPTKDLATVCFFVPKIFLSKEQWQKWNGRASSMVLEWAGVSPIVPFMLLMAELLLRRLIGRVKEKILLLGMPKVDGLLANSGRSAFLLTGWRKNVIKNNLFLGFRLMLPIWSRT